MPTYNASQPQERKQKKLSLAPAQIQADCLLPVVAAQDQHRHIAQRDPGSKLYSNSHR